MWLLREGNTQIDEADTQPLQDESQLASPVHPTKLFSQELNAGLLRGKSTVDLVNDSQFVDIDAETLVAPGYMEDDEEDELTHDEALEDDGSVPVPISFQDNETIQILSDDESALASPLRNPCQPPISEPVPGHLDVEVPAALQADVNGPGPAPAKLERIPDQVAAVEQTAEQPDQPMEPASQSAGPEEVEICSEDEGKKASRQTFKAGRFSLQECLLKTFWSTFIEGPFCHLSPTALFVFSSLICHAAGSEAVATAGRHPSGAGRGCAPGVEG